jgi:hypothetical protein
MIQRTISKFLLAAAVVLTAGAAAAQGAPGRLKFDTSADGTQASFVSGGMTIRIGRPSDALQKGALMDLDGDGAQDAIIETLWEDGSTIHLWLRRGSAFVVAGSIDAVGAGFAYQDLDGDGKLEVLAPAPEPDAVFQMLDKFLGRKSGPQEALSLFRYADGKYVWARLECVSALRLKYIAALDSVSAALTRNANSIGSSYDGNGGFIRSIQLDLEASIAAWRKRFENGCIVS